MITKRIRGTVSGDGTYCHQFGTSLVMISLTFLNLLHEENFVLELRSPNKLFRWRWNTVWMRSTEPVIYGENLPMTVNLPTDAELFVSGALPGSPIEFEIDIAE